MKSPSTMKIEKLLSKEPGLKRAQIAKKTGLKKAVVSKFLHGNKDMFFQDEEYRWFINEVEISLPGRWVSGRMFEDALESVGCLFSSQRNNIKFVIPEGCYLMLEASARLLALCNQLADEDKYVVVDFSKSKPTLAYLNRAGFLDHLNMKISIAPWRPRVSTAKTYKGKNEGVFEVRSIDPLAPDTSIPRALKEVFVSHAGPKYEAVAFTILPELFSNVWQHSKTRLNGFAALQKYKGPKPHLQTVVSDSGIGILASLKPVFASRYPKLAREFDLSDPNSGLDLIERILKEGGISSREPSEGEGGGAGLCVSQKQASKFNATISIRQETSELILSYKSNGAIRVKKRPGLTKLRGTHVCFDFILD